MLSNPTTKPETQNSSDFLAILRTGIFLYIAIAETLLTIGLLLREIFISAGIEPKNIELFTESSQILILIAFGPLLSKVIKSGISKGRVQADKILRNAIFVLVGTVLFTLLHNNSLIYLFPESYWINLDSYERHLCLNPDPGWLVYYFDLIKYIVIGILFTSGKK